MEDFEELRTEQENGNHVGNDDEANGHISDIPDLLDLHRDRKDGQDKVDPLEDLHQLFTEEVLHAGAELDIEAKVAGIGKQHNGDPPHSTNSGAVAALPQAAHQTACLVSP